MFERFAATTRAVVERAVVEARDHGDGTVDPRHLLLGLVAEPSGAGGQVLRDAGLTLDGVRAAIAMPDRGVLSADDVDALRLLGIDGEEVLRRLEESFGTSALPAPGPRRGRTRMTRTAKRSLELALREAVWMTSREIGTEHLLLGILRCDDPGTTSILVAAGAPPDELRAAVLRAVGRAA